VGRSEDAGEQGAESEHSRKLAGVDQRRVAVVASFPSKALRTDLTDRPDADDGDIPGPTAAGTARPLVRYWKIIDRTDQPVSGATTHSGPSYQSPQAG
jgi:hypothetical protein